MQYKRFGCLIVIVQDRDGCWRWRVYGPGPSFVEGKTWVSQEQAMQQAEQGSYPQEQLPKPKTIWQRPANYQSPLKEIL